MKITTIFLYSYKNFIRTLFLYVPSAVIFISLYFLAQQLVAEKIEIVLPWAEKAAIIAATFAGISFALSTAREGKLKMAYVQASEAFFRSCISLVIGLILLITVQHLELWSVLVWFAKVGTLFYALGAGLFFAYGLVRLNFLFIDTKLPGIK